MGPVIQELRDKGLLKVDDGASIVDLSAYDMPPCIILRSDGATYTPPGTWPPPSTGKKPMISLNPSMWWPISRPFTSGQLFKVLS